MRDEYYIGGACYSESYGEKKIPLVYYKVIIIARKCKANVITTNYFCFFILVTINNLFLAMPWVKVKPMVFTITALCICVMLY